MRATIDKIPLFYVAPPANFINRLIITTTRFSTTIFQCQGLIKILRDWSLPILGCIIFTHFNSKYCLHISKSLFFPSKLLTPQQHKQYLWDNFRKAETSKQRIILFP